MYNLIAPHFQDADEARKYIEALRWPNGPVCPHCGVENKAWPIESGAQVKGAKTRKGLYKCGTYGCLKQFTVTVGTVFEDSKVPLNKWLMAVYLMSASKKGISAHQLHRMLDVTYKTAWFMCHRIREAMDDRFNLTKLGSGGGIVEADETYWGTDKEARTEQKKRGKRASGGHHKMKILSLVERGGNARSFKLEEVTAMNLKDKLMEHVSRDAHLMTDEAPMYKVSGKEFASHESVNHSEYEYARGIASTNTVEGFFSILKRGLIGTYHHVGEQHLKMYVKEFDFRYNNRKVSDAERADKALIGIGGKRLTYRGPSA